MLSYWGDPENDFISRIDMHKKVLKLSATTFYRHFTPAELQEIENEAVEIRKKNSSRQRAMVLESLYKGAIDGNTTAAKEFLDRTEGKVPDKVDANVNVEQTRIIRRKTRDGDDG